MAFLILPRRTRADPNQVVVNTAHIESIKLHHHEGSKRGRVTIVTISGELLDFEFKNNPEDYTELVTRLLTAVDAKGMAHINTDIT